MSRFPEKRGFILELNKFFAVLEARNRNHESLVWLSFKSKQEFRFREASAFCKRYNEKDN